MNCWGVTTDENLLYYCGIILIPGNPSLYVNCFTNILVRMTEISVDDCMNAGTIEFERLTKLPSPKFEFKSNFITASTFRENPLQLSMNVPFCWARNSTLETWFTLQKIVRLKNFSVTESYSSGCVIPDSTWPGLLVGHLKSQIKSTHKKSLTSSSKIYEDLSCSLRRGRCTVWRSLRLYVYVVTLTLFLRQTTISSHNLGIW